MQKGILMHILDTDIVVWIMREEKRIIQAVDEIAKKDKTGVSTVTIAEIYKNIFTSEISKFDDFLRFQEIFPVTVEVAKKSGLYWQKYHTRLKNLSLTDCLVAATAGDQRAVVFTLNTRHFPMKDIRVMNPLD